MDASDELICPQAWKWREIYRKLEMAYEDRNDRSIPRPPDMLPPNANAMSLKHRWEDTVNWANTNGFAEIIPVLTEEEEFIVHH